MKSMINKMMKKAGLMQQCLFMRWKLETFTDVERRRTLHKNRILSNGFDVLCKKLRNHQKAGLSKISGQSFNTNMQKRIINRLSFVYFGRLKNAFNDWRADTFTKFKEELERKKAKVIDEFMRQSMSPFQKAFLKWARFMRDQVKSEFVRQIKAGFLLTMVVNRKVQDNKVEMLRAGMIKIQHNPERLMRSCFEKMLRAVGLNMDRAWLSWRMRHLSKDRDAAMRARKKVAASNLANRLEKKRMSHLRSGVRPLARGVAHTKTQERVFKKCTTLLTADLRTHSEIGQNVWIIFVTLLNKSVLKYAEGSLVAQQLSSSYPLTPGGTGFSRSSRMRTK